MGFIDIIILLFGAYMFCTAIYNMVMVSDRNGMIVNGVSILVGGILVYIGMYGKCSGGPSAPSTSYGPANPFAGQGGGRRRR